MLQRPVFPAPNEKRLQPPFRHLLYCDEMEATTCFILCDMMDASTPFTCLLWLTQTTFLVLCTFLSFSCIAHFPPPLFTCNRDFPSTFSLYFLWLQLHSWICSNCNFSISFALLFLLPPTVTSPTCHSVSYSPQIHCSHIQQQTYS